jgi:hypothetical protein
MLAVNIQRTSLGAKSKFRFHTGLNFDSFGATY